MPTSDEEIKELVAGQEYKYGFVSEIEADEAPVGSPGTELEFAL